MLHELTFVANNVKIEYNLLTVIKPYSDKASYLPFQLADRHSEWKVIQNIISIHISGILVGVGEGFVARVLLR